MAITLQQTPAVSVQRTAAAQTVTAAGSVAAGAKSVSFANSGSKVGTVAGANLPPGATFSFDTTGTDTLAAIAYDPTKDAANATTGTTFIITTLI
jgi:hypothetical protein